MSPFVLFGVILGFTVLVALGANRGVATLVLLAMAGFCGFGFLASFEPPGHIAWKIGYALSGVACVAGAVWPWLSSRSREVGH